MHLLLLQLAAFLVEQVGVLVDEVEVVARSDGHRVTATLGQTVISLKDLTSITYACFRKLYVNANTRRKHLHLVKRLMYKHAAVDDGFAVRRRLGQFVVHDGHVVGHLVVGLLQIHLAGELLTHLIKGLCGPVSKPVQDTPEAEEFFFFF